MIKRELTVVIKGAVSCGHNSYVFHCLFVGAGAGIESILEKSQVKPCDEILVSLNNDILVAIMSLLAIEDALAISLSLEGFVSLHRHHALSVVRFKIRSYMLASILAGLLDQVPNLRLLSLACAEEWFKREPRVGGGPLPSLAELDLSQGPLRFS
ncbi:hypothetical protein AcV5_008916 [Taiwanofungus camphoratus]|nr:hypothetical protein AcV5_008916 [Antrodia cinnamomea]